MEVPSEFGGRCIFPSLVCNRNIDPEVEIVTLPSVEGIGNVSEDDRSSTSRIIEVAWSIILSKYTDSQTVIFGILCNAGNNQSLEQWQATIDERAPINSATKLQRIREWLPDDNSYCNIFNTCVQFEGKSIAVAGPKIRENVSSPMVSDITVLYRTSVLDNHQAWNVIYALNTVLDCLISQPLRPVTNSHWNSQSPSEPLDCCVHTLFRFQCMMQPDAQAICAWDGVQAKLMEHIAERESIVPILFEKSKWAVVAMVAVLKAGAAFVMLDPSYPKERLQDICDDVRARAILCSPGMVGKCRVNRAIVINDSVLQWNKSRQSPPVTSRDIAYPKGVLIEHGSFCTNAIAGRRPHNLDHRSRVLQFASYAFDVRGCVCIPSELERVNWAELTPSVARLLQPQDVPGIKTLVLGGESMTAGDIALWKDHCTVVSTIQPDVDKPYDIGRSFGGTCWIVDKDNHDCLLPIGATGELLIGGPIVGRGYLNRPNQTAATFIANPDWAFGFGIRENRTFYKTGDLARYLSDGSIFYIGRKDSQVKVNGQRIELEEIEHHARRCFEDTYITAEIAVSTSKRSSLVLFVADRQQFSDDSTSCEIFRQPTVQFLERIRIAIDQLKIALPRHMIPAAYIPLSFMPVSKTGKVARNVLKLALSSVPDAQLRNYRPSSATANGHSPVTATQRTIRDLFAEILDLRVEDVGLDSGFFELGGDSISSIALVARAREQDIGFSVAHVFTFQTPSKLAANVEAILENDDDAVLPFSLLGQTSKAEAFRCAIDQCEIGASQVDDIYPCTPLQEACIVCTMNRPGSFQAQFSFKVSPTIDLTCLKHVWHKVADSNPILRTRIIQTPMLRMLQVVTSNDVELPWELVEQGSEVSQPMMGLGSPLVQFALSLPVDDSSSSMFTLIMHHSVFDGWSYRLMLEAAEAVCKGLDICRHGFAPFIKYVSAIDMNIAKQHWALMFQGLRPVIFPQCPPPGYVPRSVATADCHIKLNGWPRGAYTPTMIIRLALALLISWCTDTNDVVFGVTVTGRTAPVSGIHQSTGPTIATIPLRVTLDSRMTVVDTLIIMQDHSTKMIPYEQVGLRTIRRISEDAAVACGFQTLLVIQPPSKPTSPGVFQECPENTAEQLKYNTHVLTLVCDLGDSSVVITGVADDALLPRDELLTLLRRFEYLLHQITNRPTAEIGSIIPVSETCCMDGLGSLIRVPSLDSRNGTSNHPHSNGKAHPVVNEVAFNHATVSAQRARKVSYQSKREQAKLKEIFAHVLGVEIKNLSIHDDFFALGGDSAATMQVVMLSKQKGLPLTTLDIFDGRTVELIASRLEEQASLIPEYRPQKAKAARFSLLDSTPPGTRHVLTKAREALGIQESDIEDIYPCTAVHLGLLLTQSLEPFKFRSYTIWEVTSSDIHHHSIAGHLQKAWSILARRHPALRTVLIDIPACGRVNKTHHVVLKETLSDVQVLSCADDGVLSLLCNSSPQDQQINQSPLQFTICKTNTGRVLCKLEGGQALVDATSVLILMRELAQVCTGQPPDARGPLYSSAVEYLQKVSVADSHRYWKGIMAEIRPCIFPQLGDEALQQKQLHVARISLNRVMALKKFCARNKFTIGNVFEVAWGLVLKRHTNSDDVCFGTLVSGRDLPIPEIQDMVGSFFNLLCARLHFKSQSSVLDVLQQNQREIGNRLSHQHYPLTEAIRLSDHYGRRLFNTCVSMEQSLSSGVGGDGLRFQELSTHEPTEYDVVVTIVTEKDTVDVNMTYWSSVLTEKEATAVMEMFRASVNEVLGTQGPRNHYYSTDNSLSASIKQNHTEVTATSGGYEALKR
ncbi:nonribosomal peptide synthase SidD [Aspergillus taichungensis]|uniref:Nonribosomal peptide synthase SidD n=1 Tax=Aspergillus taichungensis TaxID=482145 RepID=A0A2J5HS85_9EURO|nr:nonribosomal peptide synthase SidD [Aspergillus taichungensis]